MTKIRCSIVEPGTASDRRAGAAADRAALTYSTVIGRASQQESILVRGYTSKGSKAETDLDRGGVSEAADCEMTVSSTMGRPVELPKAIAQIVPLLKLEGAAVNTAVSFPRNTPIPTTTNGRRMSTQLLQRMSMKGLQRVHCAKCWLHWSQ